MNCRYMCLSALSCTLAAAAINPLLALGLAILIATPTSAGEPPLPYIGFRYDNTGVFPADAQPPTDFDGPSGKNLLWKAPLPNFGNASPLVVQGPDGIARVFTLCDHGWPLGEGDTPVLVCHNADDGKLLWKKAIDPLDAMPKEKAAPLRTARNAYWRHQHEAARLFYRWREEAKTDEEKAALVTQMRQHAPDLSNNKPVEKAISGKVRQGMLHWTAALNHPDCEPLRKSGLIGTSNWNWTGMGQAMCTPVSDGQAIYVITGLKTVTKLDLNGKVLWHLYQEDATHTKFYECWLANGLHILHVPDGGRQRRLLVFEIYETLWAYDCDTVAQVWKAKTIGGMPASAHVCGTPQLLRLNDGAGKQELLVVTRSGHVIRARDGQTLAENLFNVDYAGCLSDGRDRVWIKQVGGDGGNFTAMSGSTYDKKCMAGLRFRLQDGKLAHERIFYDEQKINKGIADWLGFAREKVIISKNLDVVDAATGATVAAGPRGYQAYNGSILAGGHFYGVDKTSTVEGAPKGAKVGDPGVDARMICSVAKDGSPINLVGTRTIEIIAADPKDPAERAQRIALCGGRVLPGEWYNWHAAYVAPFAWKQRLYVRSFNYLYCFGKK